MKNKSLGAVWLAIIALAAFNLIRCRNELGTQATFRTENIDVTNQADVANGLIAHSGVTLTSSSGPTVRSIASNPDGSVTGTRGDLRLRTDAAALYQNTNGDTAWRTIASLSQINVVSDGFDTACNFDGVTNPVCGATLSGDLAKIYRAAIVLVEHHQPGLHCRLRHVLMYYTRDASNRTKSKAPI